MGLLPKLFLQGDLTGRHAHLALAIKVMGVRLKPGFFCGRFIIWLLRALPDTRATVSNLHCLLTWADFKHTD